MKFTTPAAKFGALILKGATIMAVSIAPATPATAEESGIAQLALDTFVERCSAILSDPDAAVASATGREKTSGMVTGDGALLQYTEQPKLTVNTTGAIMMTRTRLPGGSVSSCGMSIDFLPAGDGSEPFPELLGLVGARAASILAAPTTRRGSETIEDGELGHMFVWSTGDSPHDPLLWLFQYPKFPKIVHLGITLPSPSN